MSPWRATAAASRRSTDPGTGIATSAGTITCSAYEPDALVQATWSPGSKSVTPGPTAPTTPAPSVPTTCGNSIG